MMLQHQTEHDHQTGCGLKRKTEDEDVGKKYRKGDDHPETVALKLMRPDKEVSGAKGCKVDSSFYPQTKSQQRDLKIFQNESLPRLKKDWTQPFKKRKALNGS